MSKTYAQVVKQIESLRKEAESLRKKEIDGVVARIKEAISFYNLSAADLGLGVRAKGPKAAAKPGPRKRGAGKSRGPAVVKFRDEAGNTWGGRGPRPRWLREALSNGKSLNDFAV